MIDKYTEERPWGGFEQFCLNTPVTVKILKVTAGEAFSLQTHEHRDEFWRVLSGKAIIIAGEKEVEANPGDEFYMNKGDQHRISAIEDTEVLEVAFGHFDENDITRLEDKYQRS